MSLRRRIALAIALTVAFYGLAIVVAVGLIAAPVLGYLLAGSGNVWVAIAMIGAGLAILRELWPERATFEPPGPQLTATGQPRLFALLAETADAAGDRPPDRVFLDLDANAAVLEHAGERIMLLGLPLLATFDADELRAVVAHEHGHYVGGDTGYGNWIWRTRRTAIKTMLALRESDRWFRSGVVYWPFRGYAILFLRITNAVSRRQELVADALAAAVTSAEVTGRALRRVNGVGAAWDDFWRADAAPLLEAGHRPPLVTGFREMLAHADVASALEGLSAPDVIGGDPDPYASHPTLRQRLEAIGAPVDGGMPKPADPPALTLLDDLADLELGLLRDRFGAQVDELRAGDWDVAGTAHLDRLRATAESFAPVWAGATIADAGRLATELADVRAAVLRRLDADGPVPDEVVDGFALEALACLVTVASADAGLRVSADPGAPVTLHADGRTLCPSRLLDSIHRGEAPADAWATDPLVAGVGGRVITGDLRISVPPPGAVA